MEDKSQGMIEVLDISGVKDVKNLKIPSNGILIFVNERNTSGLIMPNGTTGEGTTFDIIKLGKGIEDKSQYKVGDLVLDFKNARTLDYLSMKTNNGEVKYILTDEYNISLAINPLDFKIPEKKKIII